MHGFEHRKPVGLGLAFSKGLETYDASLGEVSYLAATSNSGSLLLPTALGLVKGLNLSQVFLTVVQEAGKGPFLERHWLSGQYDLCREHGVQIWFSPVPGSWAKHGLPLTGFATSPPSLTLLSVPQHLEPGL